MTSACPESTPAQLCSPRFPPELFLEVFSHADRSTLAALCSTSLAFLELATPFLYETAHFDNIPVQSTPRTSRLADLLPSLALNSVRTLHFTLPEWPSPTIYSQTCLPKLDHLYILHSQLDGADPPWSVLDELLPHLNPLSITFSLPSSSDPRWFRNQSLAPRTWSIWSVGWSRLDSIVIRGGALYDINGTENEEGTVRSTFFPEAEEGILGSSSLRLTYDLRTIGAPRVEGWARNLLGDGVFDLPLFSERPIVVQTSSEEVEALVSAELRELGADGNGMVYRDRVEISRETEEEGELMLAQVEGRRRRGMEARWK